MILLISKSFQGKLFDVKYSRNLSNLAKKSFNTKLKSPLGRLWNLYSNNLEKRPLTTKCTAAAVIFFSSDSAAQYLTKEKNVEFSWDPLRALSGAFFGVIATSYLHFWWNGLEVVVQRLFPPTLSKFKAVALKVFVDQSLGAPMYIYSYYIVTNFLQTAVEKGISVKDAWMESKEKADEMLWPTMLRHWQVWPIIHSLNFYYVPIQHRTLVQNLVLVGWSGYLSHLNNGGLITPKQEVELTAEIKRRKTIEINRRETVEIKRSQALKES
mmetsp:Transcript_36739/g.41886  ORF Transcript_36739/g.41886 Transcript_36739/m.41886 type:complete len:269 (-) Transcript_36739:399-1205(-)